MNRFYLTLLVRRSFIFWLLVHVLLLLLLALSGTKLKLSEMFGGPLALVTALVVGWLVFYDAHVAREDVLLGNLGINRYSLIGAGCVLGVAFDTIASLLT